MTTLRTAARQALEFILVMNKDGWMLADYEDEMERVVQGLEAALAQEQAERKPLSEYEIRRIADTHWSLRQLARAVERAHGIIESAIKEDRA